MPFLELYYWRGLKNFRALNWESQRNSSPPFYQQYFCANLFLYRSISKWISLAALNSWNRRCGSYVGSSWPNNWGAYSGRPIGQFNLAKKRMGYWLWTEVTRGSMDIILGLIALEMDWLPSPCLYGWDCLQLDFQCEQCPLKWAGWKRLKI